MAGILGHRFRANPRYELVLLDRLRPVERDLLIDESREGDLYGVLRPRSGSDLAIRAVSPDTALLFLTLQQPATLPAYILSQLGEEGERVIGRLTLDGVLEIEHDNGFLTGPHASRIVLLAQPRGGQGRIGELSIAAMRYAQELELPPPVLAMRLYLYGRRPVTPELKQQLRDADAVLAYLGIQTDRDLRAALDRSWQSQSAAPSAQYWRTWRRRGIPCVASGAHARYKLYVSPSVDALRKVMEAIVGSGAIARGAKAFKVGADAHGLCRPDKLVVYFDRLDELQLGAADLRDRLRGCPAHGVPFTAAVTADGLLSWGADPPPTGTEGTEVSSWRQWVTGEIAQYLFLAQGERSNGSEPWQFALARLQLSGIDTDTWAPRSEAWPEILASS
jgi:hypothetical protein